MTVFSPAGSVTRYCGLLRIVITPRESKTSRWYDFAVYDQSQAQSQLIWKGEELRLPPALRDVPGKRISKELIDKVAKEICYFGLVSMEGGISDYFFSLGQYDNDGEDSFPVIRHLSIVRNPSRRKHA